MSWLTTLWDWSARRLASIGGWFRVLSERELGTIAAIVLTLVAVQAASLLYLGRQLWNAGATSVVTAPAAESGARGVVNGTFAIVAFHPEAKASEIARLFEAHAAEIVEGPKAGIWRVRLAARELSPEGAEPLLAPLRGATSLIAFVALAK